jgi:hypothetical protein
MIEVACPQCSAVHWEIDNDYRGMGGEFVEYSKRTYECPSCATVGEGFETRRKSPPEFFLQPHPMYKMSRKEYDFWWEIFVANFPEQARERDRALPKPIFRWSWTKKKD